VTVSSKNGAKSALPFDVIFEDERLVVINKSAGLLTVGNEKERERTAYRMVSDYVKAGDPDAKIFIIHRIDRDTSGVVMFAKDEKTKRAYQEKWDELVKKRGYVAVAEGRMEKDEDTLVSYLRETREHEVFVCEEGDRGAKKAVTKYSVIKAGARYSLLDVTIETGRKNQIRVQLADAGHPVCGDKRYGAKTNPHRRLSLHASELSLISPFDGKVQTFRAPTPKAFWKL
jgi:23S rRNA pseudouridine1911/1915/1917 synthase